MAAEGVPVQLSDWLQRQYPKPQVDPEWLRDCYAYVAAELQPANLNQAIEHVHGQLLASDLRDSVIRNTGLPAHFANMGHGRVVGPVLVQIMSITDIGHSAFSLQNVRQTRIERADLNGLVDEQNGENPGEGGGDDPDQEDEGPIPKYPRGMLRLQLSDGTHYIPAIEFKRLPYLQLGETPLGCKLLLRNVLVRKGIAFLEPETAIMKGSSVEELEVNQDADFARGLRMRLGLPEPDNNNGAGQDDEQTQVAPAQGDDDMPPEDPPRPIAPIHAPVAARRPPPPPPPQYSQPRTQPPPPVSLPATATTTTLVAPTQSPYFSTGSSSSSSSSAAGTGSSSSRVQRPSPNIIDLSTSSASTSGASTGYNRPSPLPAQRTPARAKAAARVWDSDDALFGDDEDMLDADFQAELDNLEQQAIAGTSQQRQSQPQPQVQSQFQLRLHSQAQMMLDNEVPTPPELPSSQARPRPRERIVVPPVQTVIDIEDDSDKENTTMSQRRRKRPLEPIPVPRVHPTPKGGAGRSQPTAMDVIEISD